MIDRARYCRNTGEPFIWDNSFINEATAELSELEKHDELDNSIVENTVNLIKENTDLRAALNEARIAIESGDIYRQGLWLIHHPDDEAGIHSGTSTMNSKDGKK